MEKLNTSFSKISNIKKWFTSLSFFFFLTQPEAQNLQQYVQPLTGTAPSTTVSAQKHSETGSEKNANTIPAVGLPFGMTQFTPQTRFTERKCIPPYFYNDSLFSGIRTTHWISGSCMQDYGSFTIMPVTGNLKTDKLVYPMPFTHQNEIATPSWYQLIIPNHNLKVEVTSSLRCGIIKFTMLKKDSLHLLLVPNSDYKTSMVKIDKSKNEITGTNTAHRIYQGKGEKAGFDGCYFFKPNIKFITSGTFVLDQISEEPTQINQADAGAYISFYLNNGESVELSIGTSFTSVQGAKNNYYEELSSKNFDQVRTLAQQVWENALGRIKVETKNTEEKYKFYTALYHALQHPRLMSDADGLYPKFSSQYEKEKVVEGGYYDDFSMWDIYRAQLPLIELLNPAMTNQFVRSLILKGKQGGWLPIFPCWNNYTAAMIGDHTAIVIASAFNKGIRNYNIKEAYQLMRKNAFETPITSAYKNGMGRRALPSYLKYGYIPMEDSVPDAFHKKEQVSRTLEYAHDDYAIATIAKALNQKKDYLQLSNRGLNYKNVFDQSVNMMRGKQADGRWATSFNPDLREAYITEGTPRQYTFYVPHDIAGLIKLMGGKKIFERALDSLFEKGEYWHGNEPGHHIPFLYNQTDSPYKTQEIVRTILKEEYALGPGGLSGNDDAGQMSAWYVFASLGFYPVNPVSGNYDICGPLFDQITIQLMNGKTLRMSTKKESEKSVYVQQIRWNGKGYPKKQVSYSDLQKGGSIEFFLSDRPKDWSSK
ncbi:MAG TPA: GH92 family glycosyl hydrolase [Niabella sp.]|nr:GH92 family glycosyl hydrolase [Niabella sp.]HOZ96486.1 GH92 family glycosyl hydrolase [Niabella sp.]HQW13333.1 GH92 family glycosyl hydrolase [Niabella sp.]HQX18627.1 GH92 family glycosyl hydrolase [Niabella sp.]HQX40280.1 GH92 family glycosyl hydrolase [Niabella sp.]